MIFLIDVEHHMFALVEFIAASMGMKGLVAAQVRQLYLFTISEI